MPTDTEKLSDEDFSQLIEDRLRTSMGASGSQIANDRLRNLEAYLAQPEGEWAPPEIDDRSDLVATDVADTIEWMLPSLMRVFASGRDAVEVTPRRPQFAPQADLVRESVKWLFWERLDGLTFLHNWLKDGLVSKVGFCRVGYSTSTITTREQFRGLTEAQVQMLLASDDVKVIGQAERVEQTDAGPIKVWDVDIECEEEDGTPTIDVVPPDEMRVDNAARYGSEPLFIAQEYERPRAELIAEGYKVAENATASHHAITSQEAQARRRMNSASMFDDDDDLVRVVDAYVRRGPPNAAKWERGLIIGDELVEREDVDGHPFGWWCPAPMPHVFFGHCPADQGIQPQRLRTRLLRAVEDNVYLSVNGRTGVVGGDETTIDDLLDSRPGGIVRLKSKDDLVPIVQPDLSGAAWQAVEWAEQWTEKRTGFSRLSKGLSSEALNDTATGVMEITERADMRVELIARHAAAALSKVLAKMLRVMGRHQDVSQAVQINGQWVDIDPRQWDTQYQVRVRVGLGSGNKDRQTAQLGQLISVQQGLAQAGMVPPPAAVALARKLTESMGFDHAEQFFPDPPPPQPPQPPLPLLIEQVKAQAAERIEQVRLQAKLQETQASLELQASNDQRDAMRSQHEADLRAQLEQTKQASDLQIAAMKDATERAVAELDAEVKLKIAGVPPAGSGAPVDLEAIARIEEAMRQLMIAVTAPKRIVRDPVSGRPIGAEVVMPQAGEAN